MARLLAGSLCPVGPVQWSPIQDRLNAALSGSLATNLLHQARGTPSQGANIVFRLTALPFSSGSDYLIIQLQTMRQLRRVKGWNFLSLQIGSNDLCSLCSTGQYLVHWNVILKVGSD